MGVAKAFAVQGEMFAVGIAGPLERVKARLETVGKAVSDSAAAMARAAASA